MDDRYICRHLRKLMRVMYLLSGSGFYARVEDGVYVFGAENPKVENRVCRSVAIYLACNTITEYQRRKISST